MAIEIFQIVGYNLIQEIGPSLAVIVFLSILWMAFSEKNLSWKKLPEKMLFAICLYLACATIVHPWYVSLPVVLCLFTRFRFPILWSGLAFLTYINYSYPDYFENLWMVGIEYIAVFGYFGYEFFWEKINRNRSANSSNDCASAPVQRRTWSPPNNAVFTNENDVGFKKS